MIESDNAERQKFKNLPENAYLLKTYAEQQSIFCGIFKEDFVRVERTVLHYTEGGGFARAVVFWINEKESLGFIQVDDYKSHNIEIYKIGSSADWKRYRSGFVSSEAAETGA